MKDFWLLYDYFKSWWRILFICCALGIFGAVLIDQPKIFAKESSATTTSALPDEGRFTIPAMIGDVIPRLADATQTMTAFDGVSGASGPPRIWEVNGPATRPTASRLHEYNGNSVDPRGTATQGISGYTWDWWKGTTLGGVVGLLVAIGIIYVWTDAKVYRLRGQTLRSK
ncbi:MAG: hypothetical protein BZY75_06230 [SAR202 cluster bacterium Io17-Chloro-G7]|nr:MAG: hypothetical protein BZY75_06230 [SAR202 cluster bacterium Io17-Chloro-G7]